jgi:hypothetical protein
MYFKRKAKIIGNIVTAKPLLCHLTTSYQPLLIKSMALPKYVPVSGAMRFIPKLHLIHRITASILKVMAINNTIKSNLKLDCFSMNFIITSSLVLT